MKSRPTFLVAWAMAGTCACSAPAPASSGAGGASPVGGAAAEAGAVGKAGEGSAGSDETAPRVVAATPALDAAEVYPAPLWDGEGEEVIVEISFSEAMAPHSDFVFESLEQTRPGAGSWSADAKTLMVVARPDFAFPRPLADDTTYSLDLTSLASEAGGALEPNVGLRGGRLVFRTGRHDALLNHSCGHTFFGPFASVGAASAPDDSAPDIGKTHTEYTVTLPESGDEYGGWLRANFVVAGNYRLYFDNETRVSLNDGDAEALRLLATPLACPGIAYQLTLTPPLGEELFLQLEAKDSPVRRVIVELVPDDDSASP